MSDSTSLPINEDLIQQFEDAMFSKQASPIEDYLPEQNQSTYLGTLLELIQIEMELAWRDWQNQNTGTEAPSLPARIGDYMERFSALRDSPDCIELLSEYEFDLRWKFGDQPSRSEYAEHAPRFADSENGTVDNTPATKPRSSSDIFNVLRTNRLTPGQQIDRYRMIAEQGRGGFGTVWRAIDTKLNREIAFKLLHVKEKNYPFARERFVNEAKITARLDHPGIVAVHDVSHLDSQWPYYTMKLVRGKTLSQKIKELHQPHTISEKSHDVLLRGLLRSFLSVCKSMQFAHSQNVIHRDLKPQNIIVGKFGETIILDWGLAKDLNEMDNDLSESTDSIHNEMFFKSDSGATQTGEVKGTPAYMSPEQAHGNIEQIDQLSDVFCLGAILFHVLTGSVPFEGSTAKTALSSAQENLKRTPRQINRNVDRAIESICLKAMATQKTDRYSSVKHLVNDIENYLADQPVSAHPESLLTQTGRWMRGHRQLVRAASIAAIVGLIGLTIGIIMISSAYQRADNARRISDAAKIDADRARDKAQDREREAARQFDRANTNLDLAKSSIEALLVKITRDPRLEDKGIQPLLAEIAREAELLYESLVAKQGDDIKLKIDRVTSFVQLARINSILEDTDKAYRYAQQAVELSHELEKLEPLKPYHLLRTCSTRRLIADIYQDRGQFDKAVAVCEENIRLIRAKEKEIGNSEASTREMIANLSSMSHMRQSMGHFESGIKNAKQMIHWCEQRIDQDPDNLDAIRQIVTAYNLLAGVLEISRTVDPQWTTESAARKAIEYSEKALLISKKQINFRNEMVDSFSYIGKFFRRRGNLDRSIQHYKRSMEIGEQLLLEQPELPSVQHRHSQNLSSFAIAFLAKRDIKQSIQTATRSVEIARKPSLMNSSKPAYRHGSARCFLNLAVVYNAAGKTTDARRNAEQAQSIAEYLVRKFPQIVSHHVALANSLMALGQAHRLDKNYELAEESFVKSLAAFEELVKRFPEDKSSRVAHAIVNNELAQIIERKGLFKEADRYWKKSLELSNPSNFPRFTNRYAHALLARGSVELAAEHGKKLAEFSIKRKDDLMFIDSLAVVCLAFNHLKARQEIVVDDRTALLKQFTETGIELVKKALAAGLVKHPRVVNKLENHPVFQPVRDAGVLKLLQK